MNNVHACPYYYNSALDVGMIRTGNPAQAVYDKANCATLPFNIVQGRQNRRSIFCNTFRGPGSAVCQRCIRRWTTDNKDKQSGATK